MSRSARDGPAPDRANSTRQRGPCRYREGRNRQSHEWGNSHLYRALERCTVGALRDEAKGHDVAIHSFDHGRFERKQKGVELGDLAERSTA